jgi:hypothetical protein
VKFVCNKSANGTTVAESTAWLMYATVLHADVKSAWLMDKVAYHPPCRHTDVHVTMCTVPPWLCACASYPQGCSAQQGVSVVPSCRTNAGPCSCRAHTQSPTPSSCSCTQTPAPTIFHVSVCTFCVRAYELLTLACILNFLIPSDPYY